MPPAYACGHVDGEALETRGDEWGGRFRRTHAVGSSRSGLPVLGSCRCAASYLLVCLLVMFGISCVEQLAQMHQAEIDDKSLDTRLDTKDDEDEDEDEAKTRG